MLGLAMGLGVGLSCGPGAFACNDDDQCQSGEFTGTCVAGYCAFPDEGCASGLAYGEHAAELSGTCVPPDSGGGSSGPSMTSVGASSATSTGSGPVDTGPVDSGPADSSDGPGPGEVVFTDDEFAGEFEDGTNDGTRWADDRLGLDARSTSGTFTSRVFDAEAVVQWQTLMWVPDGPYGKPLPDGWNGKQHACDQLARAASGARCGARVAAAVIRLWGQNVRRCKDSGSKHRECATKM